MKNLMYYPRKEILFINLIIFTMLPNVIGQTKRTQNEAKEIANTFLLKEKRDQQTKLYQQKLKSAETIRDASNLEIGEIFSIENREGDTLAYLQKLEPQGFIIISANDKMRPVLGFSFDSELSYDSFISSPIFDFLENDIYSREKSTTINYKNELSSDSYTQWGPLLQTTWNQRDQWNDKCPYVEPNVLGSRRSVGCVATALSQIVNYWQYPKKIEFSDDEYIEISGEEYFLNDAQGWGIPTTSELNTNMSSLQYNGDPSEEAFLSFASGVKLNMDYKVSSSGVNTFKVGNVLNKEFGFGSAIAHSDYLGVWSANSSEIIEDLKNGQPVQIAIHKSGKNGGHSIVVDGWREDGFFHLNYGWGSSSPDPIGTAWYNIPMEMPNYDVVHTVVYRISKYLGWNQFGANQRNTFHAIYPSPINEPVRKWAVNVPEELSSIGTSYSFSQLIIGAGGRIYTSLSPSSLGSSYHPYIAIYDKFGTFEKLIEVTHSNVKIPYLSQNERGEVFFSSGTAGPTKTDARVFKLNPRTDDISPIFIHNSPDAGSFEQPIKIDRDNFLYFIISPRYEANSGVFYSTTKSGTLRWSYTFHSSAEFHNSIPAIDEDNDRVYINYFLQTEEYKGISHLIAFERSSGTVVFDKELPTSTHYASKMAAAPSIGLDGTIYIDADDVLFALSPNNGDIHWQRTFSWRGANPITSIGANGELYVSYDDKIMSLNSESNGATIWEKSYTLGGTEYLGEVYSSSNEIVIVSYEKDGVHRMGAIKDNGASYENLWDIVGGGSFAFGSGRTLVSIPPGNESSIWTLTDLGVRGDPEGSGMDYADNTPPMNPVIIFPEDNAENQDTLSVQLSWSGIDLDGHNLKYDVFICEIDNGTEAAFVPFASQISETTYTLTDLKSGTEYLWSVMSSDGQSFAEGTVWSFKTECATIFNSEVANICEGESYIFGTQNLTSSGIFDETFIASNGCDSIVTLTLDVTPIYESSVGISICEGESYFAEGAEQTESGTYFDSLATINGCDSVIITNLSVNQLPYIYLGNDTTINSSITLDAGSSYESYLWSNGSGEQTIIVNTDWGFESHEIFVVVTDNNCVNSDTIMVTIEDGTVIHSLTDNATIKIYPNPSSGILNVELDGVEDKLKIQVVTINGSVMMSKDLFSNNDVLDLSGLDNGVYLLNIIYNDIINTRSIILNK